MNDAAPLSSLARCRTAIDIALWRHGVAGVVATACALAALALHLLVNIPARDELANLQSRIDRQTRAAATAPAPMSATAASTAPGPLLQTLQAAPALADALQTMYALADAQHIAVPRAEYRQQAAAAGAAGAASSALRLPPRLAPRLSRVEVTQPLRASYPQLRRYLEAVLREIPSASLDQLSVRRDTAAQPMLDVRLRWSLWQAEPGAPEEAAAVPAGVPALAERRWLVREVAGNARAPDLFAARGWQPPSPAAGSAPPAAAPEAAPLPFSYLGKQFDEGRWSIFVARGADTLVLREGQIVDGLWRIDATTPPALRLTYLPLGQAFTLPIGDER